MKLTPLALAVALFALPAYAQDEDDCPSDEQLISSMSLAELQHYEYTLKNPEMSFEEACNDATEDDDEKAIGSRQHYCVKRSADYSSYNTDTGTVETAKVTMYDYVTLPRTGTTWNHRIRVEFEPVQGNAMAGLIVAPDVYCGSCTDRQQFDPQTLAGPGTYEFVAALGFDTENGMTSQNTQLVLTRFDVDETPIQMVAPQLRCDKIATTHYSGCRFSTYPSVLEISQSDADVDESAVHLRDAQMRLPGNVGRWSEDPNLRGEPLTRLKNFTAQTANRSAAKELCRSRFPGGPGAGQNCDEYPFASTKQGAALVPEDSMSVKYIDGSDNKRVGGRLSEFFCATARLHDGDEFWVSIKE